MSSYSDYRERLDALDEMMEAEMDRVALHGRVDELEALTARLTRRLEQMESWLEDVSADLADGLRH